MRVILVVLATVARLLPTASAGCSRPLLFAHVAVSSENNVYSLQNIQAVTCQEMSCKVLRMLEKCSRDSQYGSHVYPSQAFAHYAYNGGCVGKVVNCGVLKWICTAQKRIFLTENGIIPSPIQPTGTVTRGWCPAQSDRDPYVEIHFDNPSTVSKLRFWAIAFNCHSNAVVDVPHMTHFNLTYRDSLDPDKQDKAYPTILQALGNCRNDTYCQSVLPSGIFTDKITIRPTQSHNMPCFAIEAIGCQHSASDIAVDDVGFLSMADGVMTTPSGKFDGVGELELIAGSRRRHTNHRCHFYGHGGSLSHSSHHSSHHDHHHSFFNPHSHPLGHCTSVHAVFGHGHNHNHPIFLHSASHSSLVYNSHSLAYHVTNGVKQWLLHCTWKPTSGLSHVISTSYHHTLGISLHVNNRLLCSSHTPLPGNHHPVAPGVSGSLCIGRCHLPPAPTNVSLSNLQGVGASRPALNALGLQGMIGSTSGKTLSLTTGIPLPTSATTTKATKPTAATTTKSSAPPTTTTHAVPSATTLLKTAVTTVAPPPGNGPVCYTCGWQAKDGQCKSVSRCQVGEVCAVFEDPTGYHHECLKKNVCQVSKSLVKTCFKCCISYLCNERCSSAGTTTVATTTTTAPKTTTAPCLDSPTCSTLSITGYRVCSDVSIATTICNSTCHTC